MKALLGNFNTAIALNSFGSKYPNTCGIYQRSLRAHIPCHQGLTGIKDQIYMMGFGIDIQNNESEKSDDNNNNNNNSNNDIK